MLTTIALLTSTLVAQGEAVEMPTESLPRVVVLDVGIGNLPSELQKALTESLTGGVAKSKRFAVMNANDMKEMFSYESQQQLVGCDDESCLSEIVGAMAADYVVTGSVTLLGDRYAGTAKLIDARVGAVSRRVSRQIVDASRLVTLMQVLGIEVMGGKADPAVLADLTPPNEIGRADWSVGVKGGGLFSGSHYVDIADDYIDTKPGFMVAATGDIGISPWATVGAQAWLGRAEYRRGGDVTILSLNGTVKGRFKPFWDGWEVRPGLALGYQRLTTDTTTTFGDIGAIPGVNIGAMLETAFVSFSPFVLLAEIGFISQPAGGNAMVDLTFAPQFYSAVGLAWAGE